MIEWQNFVFTVGGIVFTIALLPSILGPHKPSKWTSILTATLLVSFTVSDFSLGWVEAGCATGLNAIGWSILALQAEFMMGKYGHLKD